MRRFLIAAIAVLFPLLAHAATYTVVPPGTTAGPGQFVGLYGLYQAQKNNPFIKPGDTIDVQAGVYNNDWGTFNDIGTPANPVTFTAVGGYAYFPDQNGAGNNKGTLLFDSSDVVVNGFVFVGYPSGEQDDGAGIRLGVDFYTLDANGQPYPSNLTVQNSGFLSKADGILADDCNNSRLADYAPAGFTKFVNAPCAVSIDHSWFSGNGSGYGLSHGIYIDHYNQLTVTNNLFYGGWDGHLLKSRAFNTDIENNTIVDGPFATSNTLIDIPQGGSLTVKNNTLEIGPHNYNGFIDYNVEAYPPELNNTGAMTAVITGNTFIDDFSATASYTPNGIWDDSLDTDKTAPLTHIPSGSTVSWTITGNTFYSPKLTAANIFNQGNTNGGGYGYSPSHPVLDGSNTILTSGAPALHLTPPIAWPPVGTPMQTLDVQANGFPIPTNNDGATPYTYPQVVLWWNGVPLTPAPVSVTADQTTSAQQTITYQVPVIPGAAQSLGAWIQNGACCETDTGASLSVPASSKTITVNFPNYRQPTGTLVTVAWNNFTIGGIAITAYSQFPITVVDANNFTFQAPSTSTSAGTSTQVVYFPSGGLNLNLLGVSLNGSTPVQFTTDLGGALGGTDATLPIQPSTIPPADTTKPVLATNAPFSAAGGSTTTITSSILNATDTDNTAAQLTYTFAAFTGPSGTGTLTDNGVAASSFSQADVNAGLVDYTAPTAAGSESLPFTVTDPAGNSVSGTLAITVTSPGVHPTLAAPVALTVPEGVTGLITSTNLSASETNYTPAQLKYTVTTAPAHGTITANGVFGASTFTQADVNAGNVSYETGVYNGSDSFAFSVADPQSNATTGTLPITVQAPGSIILAPPVGISVAAGKAATVASTNLSFTCTPYTTAQLFFVITALPTHGTLTDKGTPVVVNQEVLQSDVAAGSLLYTSTGTAGGTDSFGFNAETPAGTSTPGTLPITITGDSTPPVVISPPALSVPVGTTVKLSISATDPDNTPLQTTWKVTTAPTKGTLFINGTAAVVNSTFTGQDMNNGLITYKSTGTVAASDTIAFSLTDPAGNSATATQNVTITVDTSAPLLPTPVTLTVSAGVATALTTTNLNASDVDNTTAQLLYTVTAAPTKGSIKRNGVASSTFTQADIAAGAVTYTSTGTGTDSVAFTIADPAGNSVAGTLSIAIVSDTTPPSVAAFKPLSALSGTAAPLALVATDPDNTADQLTYTVTTPPTQGSIQVSGVNATTFTQTQMAQGVVTYLSTSTTNTTDSVGLKVADPAGNSANITLSISVLSSSPVVLPPNSFSIPMFKCPSGYWGWKACQ